MKRPLLIALCLFFIAELLLGWWLWSNTMDTTQRSLQFHQTELSTGFRSVVDSHQKLVEISLHHLLKSEGLLPMIADAASDSGTDNLRRIRGRLYRMLYKDYKKLQEQDIRVLQFVLPDGRSLLRFNRPDLYGDLIARERPLLSEVLRSNQAGRAFENGRVYPGFRYTFPLIYEGQLVGLADFSLSYDGIRRSFQESKQVTGSFSKILLRRNLLESVTHPSAKSLFKPAKANPEFVVEDEKSPLRDILKLIRLPNWIDDLDQMLLVRPEVQKAMAEGVPYSLTLCTSQQQCYGISLHPVLDSSHRSAAYVIAYTDMPEYAIERNQSLISFSAVSMVFLLSSLALRRWLTSRGQLQTISEHMGEGMYVVDRSGHIIYTNPAATKILGYTGQEMRGANAHNLFHEHSNEKHVDSDLCPIRNKPMHGSVYTSSSETFRCKSGNLLRIAVTSSPLQEEGGVSGAVILFRDISGEYENQKRLLQANTALKQLAEGVVITDTKAKVVAVNQAFTNITGYGEEDILGETPAILASGRHDSSFYADLWSTILHKGYWEGEIWNRRKDGRVYPEWLKITAMKSDEGEVTGFVGVFSDITELKRSEKQLQNLAYRDQLTGLHNRVSFMQLSDHSLAQARRYNKHVAILFLDVDRFKRINDSLGHAVGDELLKQVASRLVGTVREEDTIARLGGDEFAFLIEGVPNHRAVTEVANKILEVLREPINYEDNRLDVTASIGISVFPENGNDSATLLKNADAAMYLAKQEGRDQIHYFIKGMDNTFMERFELERELHRALEQNELVLFYQPKVSIPSGSLIGMEALIRWQHPIRGLLTPFHFLNVAEEAGLMQMLTEQVLEMAARQCARWKQSGYDDICIAVNLDAQFLKRCDAEQLLMETLDRNGIQPVNMELEIVETAILQEENYIELWRRLADLGFRISIDDFGTGESSLSRLKEIPVKVLKVDQSFVRDIEIDENDRAIVQTVIAMANTLEKDVIAEGVESEEQLRFLYQSGCYAIQGYYFSRPVPAAEAKVFLEPGYFSQKASIAAK